MTVEELEKYIFDVIEKHYTFLNTDLVISRINKDIWRIKFPYKDLTGEGETKEEALKNLLLKINNVILNVA